MIKLLVSLNDVVYELLLWFVLIPKTLFRVILSPKWIAPYVESELGKEPADRFDTYAPPVIFFVVLGALPLTYILSRVLPVVASEEPVVTAFKNLGLETQILATVVFLSSWPLASALVIQYFRGEPVGRTSLQVTFYPQAYCYGALYVSFYIAAPFAYFAWRHHFDVAPLQQWWLILATSVPAIYFYWFIYGEICVLRWQLHVGAWKALGVLVLFYVAGILMMVVSEVMILASILPSALKWAAPTFL